MDEPAVPPRPAPGVARTDPDKAAYTDGLHTAWGDCYDTVGATKERKAAYKAQYDKATKSTVDRVFGGLFGKKQ